MFNLGRVGWSASLTPSSFHSVVLRGCIVIRTHNGPKNPHITLFLHTILGPDYYVAPVIVQGLTWHLKEKKL